MNEEEREEILKQEKFGAEDIEKYYEQISNINLEVNKDKYISGQGKQTQENVNVSRRRT